MAFDPKLEHDEAIEEMIQVIVSGKPYLQMLLTTRAAYWPKRKAWAVADDVTHQVAPVEQISLVRMGRARPLKWIAGGAVAAALGLFMLLLPLFVPGSRPPAISLPAILLIGGVFVAVSARHRRFLLIKTRSGKGGLRWVTPAAMRGQSLQHIDSEMARIVAWAERRGLNVRIDQTGRLRSTGPSGV
jgi:hypothetical protein